MPSSPNSRVNWIGLKIRASPGFASLVLSGLRNSGKAGVLVIEGVSVIVGVVETVGVNVIVGVRVIVDVLVIVGEGGKTL